MPDDWDSGPVSVAFNHRMRQVEDQDGVKAGDLWKHSDSGTLRVLAIDGDTAFCAESLESRKPTHRLEPTFHFRAYFYLLERDGKDVKVKRPDPKPEVKKQFTAANPSPDIVSKGIAVNDLWQYRSEDNGKTLFFRVLHFHDGIAFCFTEDSTAGHFMAKPTDKWFQTLVERNGKPVEPVKAKRLDPKPGMDLASFGWLTGDGWRAADGREFKVTGSLVTGNEVKSMDIQWQATGKRETLAELSTLTFHKLIERHGINMEEVTK